MNKILIFTTLFISTHLLAAEHPFDRQEVINDVHLLSHKEGNKRLYRGETVKKYAFSLEHMKRAVLNFDNRCNNDFRAKRKYSNHDCKYHNENLIETFTVKDIKLDGILRAPGEVERYILGRQIYNRGHYGYYELVQILEGKNLQGQKTVTVVLTMLNDKKIKEYTKPKFKKESAFDDSQMRYELTEISPTETLFKYEYSAETDHWVLNKEVSVSQVFNAIGKSVSELLQNVELEAGQLSRGIASTP